MLNQDLQMAMTRRFLFQRLGFGLGGFALAEMLHSGGQASAATSAGRAINRVPRAKRVIYVHLVGAASQLDLYDPKPELQRRDGELCPEELFEGKPFAFIRERPQLLGTPPEPKFGFRASGQSGIELSNLLPHLQGVADQLCLIRSLHTDQFNHAPAQLKLLTGFERFGRPSLGGWLNYGLGSENENLPGFVVLITGQVLGAGNSAWGSGFLPTMYQGVEFRSQGDPVLFLSDPPGVDRDRQRRMVDSINRLNAEAMADVGDPEIATRIRQYEMAYRMQRSVPDLMDISDEPAAIHAMYGTQPGKASFANNCLLARRLVERGVRFVQLFDEGWDMHGRVFEQLPKKTKQIDQPLAALIRDLRQRGLLDETLIVCAAEFGRTPMGQGKSGEGKKTKVGRDHHRDAFAVWMAGGGTKAGHVHGATDPLGYSITEGAMHVHDLNATILHLMGIDHERLTFRYQGREFRLTDVHGNVVHEVLA